MSQQYPPQQPMFQPGPPAPQPRKTNWKVVNIVVLSVAAVVIAIGAATGNLSGDSSDQEASVKPGNAQTTLPDNGPTPDPITTPTNHYTPTATVPPAKPTPKPTLKATPKPKPKPTVYKKITARQWKLIAKDPDAHAGEALTVYGEVTQFDAATGTDGFRADVDGVKHAVSYGYVDYPTNTVLTNFSGDLSDLVEGDLFTAKVLVLGSYSYDTQIGGSTTVPNLSVMSIKVTGSTQ